MSLTLPTPFGFTGSPLPNSPWHTGSSVFVIAEIGINHNGDLALAKKLIDAAKAAGCDAVKFQKRTIDLVYAPQGLCRGESRNSGA